MGDILYRPNVIGEMNHKLGYGNVMKDLFDPRVVLYGETNLIDLDDHTNSEVTSTNLEEVY